MLFNRRVWESTDITEDLRNDPSLIATIDIDTHAALHRAITCVPLPDTHMAGRLIRQFRGDPRDPLWSLDQFALTAERTLRHPKTNELDRKLGHLVIETVIAQRPFIAEGLPSGGIVIPLRR